MDRRDNAKFEDEEKEKELKFKDRRCGSNLLQTNSGLRQSTEIKLINTG